MDNQDFSTIAKRYKETSVIQSSAAEILFSLLDIHAGESVLDVGCGTGNLTKRIFDISRGRVVGIDPSEGMIAESTKHYGNEIVFQVGSMEEMTFENSFDVIFCNSTFQWVRNPEKAIANFRRALKPGGRVGIQAPAKREYCPNFLQAVEAVKRHPELGRTFECFKSPWLFLDTPQEYADMFLGAGLQVPFCKIQTIETSHTPEEVYSIFSSGAIAGYLNRAYYNCDISEDYIAGFKSAVQQEFWKQATHAEKVQLIFNRIFLIATHP